jgi:dynein heavy chain
LLVDIQEHAKAWIQAIAALMRKMGHEQVADMAFNINQMSGTLDSDPETLEELKLVLNLVAEISRTNMQVELDYGHMEEWYRTLRVYGYPIEEAEAAKVDNMAEHWEKLKKKAVERDRSLGRVKKQFTLVTQGQVAEFQAVVVEWHAEFLQKGPGTGKGTLDEGVEMMVSYAATLAAHEKTREELGDAIKLFGMPAVAYPELAEVKGQMAELTVVYDLYSEFIDRRTMWAETLWAELAMDVLEKGMEDFDGRLKKLPKQIKLLKPYKMCEEALSGFTASLPLIANLKNDALRPRHWQRLMVVTEVEFDMNPKTFTLQKLFDMQLDRFEEQIVEITGGASKELTIESGINQIADTWRVQSFEVIKYFKGDQERGLVLKPNEELVQTLEDQMMNLSSMMSSRFCAPFLELTQKWERQMSTISEVIEVWMKVQAKWMYLEAIFVGSEDIRLQLPEEAKRFDRIHGAFKKIMTETSKNPNVLDACTADKRLEALSELFSELEACQKSLSDYLETKRTVFPRVRQPVSTPRPLRCHLPPCFLVPRPPACCY